MHSLAEWLSHLESLHPKTIALGLGRVTQVRQRLDLNLAFPIIIVGGTNGKGSVCAMLEHILHAAGYRVGCYTSPHLLSYNERVRIGKQPASDVELCASFEKIEQARLHTSVRNPKESLRASRDARSRARSDEAYQVDRRRTSERATQQIDGAADYSEISLTYFEFGTLAAMQCFIEHKVDVAILEVGLGGRLDAVNIFDADCAVVTSVDLDHMDYLGDTREKIAFEKAGIFRTGKVAVFGDTDVPETLRMVAKDTGAQLQCLGEHFSFTAGKQQWNFKGAADRNNQNADTRHAGTRSALPYPALRGAFQLNNASAALAALDALKNQLPVSMDAVRRGLVETTLPGRFQVIPGRPVFILDVAHNPHAARALAQNLDDMSQHDASKRGKTFAIFSMLKDKDRAGVVRALAKKIDVWLVAGIDTARGSTATEIAAVLQGEGISALSFATIAGAVQSACNQAGENDRIVAFGSFHTVAEVLSVRGIRDK